MTFVTIRVRVVLVRHYGVKFMQDGEIIYELR